MKVELHFMRMNKVWGLKVIPKGAKTVGCKWIYKIKLDMWPKGSHREKE
jgi:hypothetical protein